MGYRLSITTMSAVRHLLRRCTRAIALVLALGVLLGSLCPRGWFVCVHEHGVVLVDGAHAQDQADCNDDDCCPADAAGADGCLDLALSLVLDDQITPMPVRDVLPAGVVWATLPDLKVAAQSVRLPLGAWFGTKLGEPPPSPFVSHIRLLV